MYNLILPTLIVIIIDRKVIIFMMVIEKKKKEKGKHNVIVLINVINYINVNTKTVAEYKFI